MRVETNIKDWAPSDGGLRAWLVVFASTTIAGLLFGVINAYSVIYVELLRIFEDVGVTDASSKTSLVGSLTIGMVYILAPVAGILIDRLGLRMTAVIGGTLATIGLAASSYLTESVIGMYLTYAVMFGSGAALGCTPCIAILGYYFRRRLGLVNGIVTAGGSVFAILVPPVVKALIPLVGLPGVLKVFALIISTTIGAAFLFTVPKEVAESKAQIPKKGLSSLINMDNWKNKKYLVWCFALPITYFGYFVPFVHIVSFAQINFPEQNSDIFIIALAFSTGISRMTFGIVSDKFKVDRILLQQVAFLCSGILTMLLTVVAQWEALVAIVVGIGLFEGGLICLIGAIAFDLCGVEGGAQAIGFIYGVSSLPLIVGPPMAGLIFDRTQSYTIPFLMAGCWPILSSIVLCAMRCVPAPQKHREVPEEDSEASESAVHMQELMNGADHNGTKNA